MTISFDNVWNVHAQSLRLRTERAETISANMANIDTPNYRARDIDFATALASSLGESNFLKATHAVHLQPAGRSGELLYRVPTQMSLDGNTVEEEQEKTEFAANALHYQASLRFMTDRIQGLMSAIKGE